VGHTEIATEHKSKSSRRSLQLSNSNTKARTGRLKWY